MQSADALNEQINGCQNSYHEVKIQVQACSISCVATRIALMDAIVCLYQTVEHSIFNFFPPAEGKTTVKQDQYGFLFWKHLEQASVNLLSTFDRVADYCNTTATTQAVSE